MFIGILDNLTQRVQGMKTVRLARGLLPIDLVAATLGLEPPIGYPPKCKNLLVREERRIRGSSHMIPKSLMETVLQDKSKEILPKLREYPQS